MTSDLDHYGGYTLYRGETPLMRWFYHFMDNAREGFDIIPLNILPEESEDLLMKKIWTPGESVRRGDLWYEKDLGLSQEELDEIVDLSDELGGEYYIQDHLTGNRIPNKRYKVAYGWSIPNCIRMILSIQYRCSCGKSRCSCRETWQYACMQCLNGLRYSIILLGWLLGYILRKNVFRQKFPQYVVQAPAWDKPVALTLCKIVHDYIYITTQSFLVLDLRRGKYYSAPCPIEAVDLRHIESFALALPGNLELPHQREMLSCIPSEKVIELTVFEPQSLVDYQQYTNLQRLFLLEPTLFFSLDGIAGFPKLEKLFISGGQHIEKLCETQTFSSNLDVKLAFDKPVAAK